MLSGNEAIHPVDSINQPVSKSVLLYGDLARNRAGVVLGWSRFTRTCAFRGRQRSTQLSDACSQAAPTARSITTRFKAERKCDRSFAASGTGKMTDCAMLDLEY